MATISAAAVSLEKGFSPVLSTASASASNDAPSCLVAKSPRVAQSEFAGKSLKLTAKTRSLKTRANLGVTRAVATGPAKVEREPYVRGWSNISKDIVTGGCPCTPDDVDKIIKGSGATALVCLQNDDSSAAIGMNWDAIKARAAEINVIAVRIPMKEFDHQDQAAALPEAVRAVASLVSMGHKVYLNCTSGKYRSPLVALGYLTFVKTLDVTEAMDIIQKNSPGASPYFDSWEEARSKLASGDSRRVAQIASSVSERRIREGKTGSPAEDWLVAQRLLVKENIERGVNTDILLSQAILATKGSAAPAAASVTPSAATQELERQNANLKEQIAFLTRQAEGLKKREKVEVQNVQSAQQDIKSVDEEIAALKKAETKAKEEVVAAKERLEFFYRQVAVLKEKEEAARIAAKEAKAKIASLTDQVSELKRREKIAIEASKTAAEKAKILAEQLDEIKNRQGSAQEAAQVATERVKFLEAQPQTPAVVAATPIAKHAEDAALTRLQELEAQVAELTQKEEQARQSLEAANERNDFFHRQLNLLKEKEAAARAQVKAAEVKIAALQKQVDDFKFREAAAKASADKATTNVDEYTSKIAELTESEAKAKKAAADAEARVAALSSQLNALLQRESTVSVAAKAANERVAQLASQANGASAGVSEAVVVNATIEAAEKIKQLNEEIAILTKRAIAAEDNVKMGQDRIDFFFRQAIALKDREQKAKKEANEKIHLFKRQVSELQRKVVIAEKETEEANNKIAVLTEKVEQLEASETTLKEQANVASDRIEFFFRQVASLREKEEAARKATENANSRIKQLLRQIEILEKKEAAATAKAEQFAEQVSDLLKQNSGLHESLLSVESREAELVKALEEGSGMLTIALEADETIRRLKSEADKASAELEAAKLQAVRLASEVEKARQTAEVSYKLDIPSAPTETKELSDQGSSIDLTANGQGTLLRNVVVGALGLAALPVTAYTLMSGTPQPGMLAEVNFGTSAPPAPEEIVLPPTVRSGQASEFCSSVPPGLRSAQTEKFCSALSEIDNE